MKEMIVFILTFVITTLAILYLLYYQIRWLLTNESKSDNEQKRPLDVETLNKEIEPYGFSYIPNQDIFISNMYPWQREYGYDKSYDDAAPLISLIIDCEPITFKYDNREWLIELWKGQYGMTTGAEIGIYVTESQNDKADFLKPIKYESVTDDERLSLYYVLKKNNKVLITRNDHHWWLTGFKLGEFTKPSELVMDLIITFKKPEMTNAFIESLLKAGYKNNEIKVINNSVYLTFDQPRTKQPSTRTKVTQFLAQNNNRFWCYLYNSLTKEYDNTLDKLNYIKTNFPGIFTQLLDIKKSKQLFKANEK